MEEKPEISASGAVSKKKEKNRRKDPRSWENVIKTISSLDDNAAKLSAIEEKYESLYNELRKMTTNYQNLEAQYNQLIKEKDHHQSELAKSVVARARLESLCRELQKQNKQIKEENLTKIKEEEERRKEVSMKFANKLSDINTMMDENKEKSEQLREENLRMTAKLAKLYSQFQKREEDISKMSHQMELERRCSQATLAKMELEVNAEKETYAIEYAKVQKQLEKSEANCLLLSETIKSLQKQIDVYKTQYQDFETTMTKSNRVFDTFKTEMATMSEQMNTIEKEANSWKTKYYESTKTIINLTETLQLNDRKIDNLSKLCRQLQADRAAFLKLLKDNGITPTSQPCTDKEKKTRKEQDLKMLKDSLKLVQDELARVKSIEKINKEEKSENSISTDDLMNCSLQDKPEECSINEITNSVDEKPTLNIISP